MDERFEAAWRAQEAARTGRGGHGGDPADRLVAQALAQPLPVDLPADFAATVARLAHLRSQAEALARATRPATPSVEWALCALAAALLPLAAWLAWHFNPDLAHALATALPSPGLDGWGWWLTAGALATLLAPTSMVHRKPT